VVFVFMGFVAAILPQRTNSSLQLTAEELLAELALNTHEISVDQMADVMINKDPAYQLIDLRSPEAFEEYHLPGAMNIPFDSLFNNDMLPYVDQISRKNVFYSNGTSLSSQAWMLTRQKGFQNNYVLQGGLNTWFDTIILPKPPPPTSDDAAFALYRKRLGASSYFTGQSAKPAEDQAPARAVKPLIRRERSKVQGGCS
jgi:rhodanese-related sulfurtransferase